MNLTKVGVSGVAMMVVVLGGCAKKKVVAVAPQPIVAAAPVKEAPAPRTEAARPASTRPPEVAKARPRMPDDATRAQIQEYLNRLQDAYFDFARHTVRPDAEAALRADAGTLAELIRQYPDFRLIVEGYCDDRGSDEYNLALGEARAEKTKEYLIDLGLPANQLKTVSYGKEHQVCSDETEDCWQKNRRTHIAQAR